MGWFDTFNTFLSVTNVAISAANYHELSQLKSQGAEAALIAQIFRALKDELFNFRQSAKEIAEMRLQQPRIAAVAAIVLEYKLENSPVSPDIFSELNDKEYAADTIKIIQEQSRSFVAQLPQPDQERVRHIAERTIQAEESKYYIDHHVNGLAVLDAKEKMERNNCAGGSGCLLLVISGLLGMFGTTIYVYSSQGGMREANPLGALLSLAATGLFIYYFARKSNCRNAKKKYEKYSKNLDEYKFAALHRKFKRSLAGAKETHEIAESEMKEFFEESQQMVGLAENIPLPVSSPPPAVADAVSQPESGDQIGSSAPAGSGTVSKLQFCMWCGTKVENNAKFCQECGKRLED